MLTFTENFPADPRAVAADLDNTGWVCAENAVSPEWMARAQAHVRGLLDQHGEKFFVIIKPADEENSPTRELARHSAMQNLLRSLTEIGCPQGIVEWEDVYNTLRIVAGPDGQKGSCEFHYDASVITVLVPIFIPDHDEGASGELAIFPNKRPYRHLLANVMEKALVQSRPYRRRMAREVKRSPKAHCRILKPGNLYFFWGYRSYHGNMPCRPNSVRATILLHYGNPHGKSALLQGFRNVRKAIERRRLAGRERPATGSSAPLDFPMLTENSQPSEPQLGFSAVYPRKAGSPLDAPAAARPADDVANPVNARSEPVDPQ